jgi:inorganic triphosphatase YgiF
VAGEGPEIERQYVLHGDEPSLPPTVGGFSLHDREERRIRDTYLDTDGRDLRGAGAVLRVRDQNGRLLATYKGTGSLDDAGTRTREEIEGPLGDDRDGHEAFVAARRHTQEAFAVVGELHNDRSAFHYRDGGDAVELVLDRLTYPDGSTERRLEVEGSAAAVRAFADALEQVVPGLEPATTSKGEELARRLGA